MAQPDFREEAEKLFGYMVEQRRDFHRHPELGFQETRTSGIVAETLQALGLEVQRGVGQTGVVALLEGANPGPTILVRFDMDALPIQEENLHDYASQNPGVMHACGHDGHTTMGLALAKILTQHQADIAGTIKFMFQPAEEGLGGAFAMIADGVLQNPRPDVALAMHLWTPEEFGKVRVVEGPCMASSSVFTLTVQGHGGHGAAPHLAVDPILAAAQIVSALQSIVSRNINPQDSVVVSIGQFSAGTTFNVIPDRAILKGTVRSYDNDLHRTIYRRILEMAHNMAIAFRCEATMETIAIVAAVNNAPEPTAVVRLAAEQTMGADNIVEHRTMASEDMGYILEEVPGCYFFIGARNQEKGFTFPHHHPRFDFDERAMVDGVAVMGQAIANYLMVENGVDREPKSETP
ncbi:MAG: amidohydrolase [Chloroflexi bacterium]|nr:amidohydrolase [Chloroflexota bacterium]MBP7043292.1 amidohydrolase [Chloroflexota bacterium]